MSVLMVPRLDRKPWPTLGPQVEEWIEENLCFGPGDLRGQPAVFDDEKRAILHRLYEIRPRCEPIGPSSCEACRAWDKDKRRGARPACLWGGRRRFDRAGLSFRKGWAKSEFAAWIAAAELHPRAPVRFGGWGPKGTLLPGIGVKDPYIPLVAYTETQSEDLVYGTLKYILENSKAIRADFDIGLERIMRVAGDGKAIALAAAPNARDGARTTFQVFDETHRFTLERLRRAHSTMLANLPKRKLAEPWSLEITTAPAPGEHSIAESAMEYAKAIDEGRVEEPTFFFFHRQATEGKHDLKTKAGVRAAVLEASGPVAAWSDIDRIVRQWNDPTADLPYLARVWLNQPIQASSKAFDAVRWADLARKGRIPDGALVAIGFDGGRFDDASAMIATDIETGFQEPLGIWEKPLGPAGKGWEVPSDHVNFTLAQAFERFDVWRIYADPPHWEGNVDAWSGEYGEERVVRWYTSRWQKMAAACLAYYNAQKVGELTHSGDPTLARHIANAFKRYIGERADTGEALWIIYKERKDSPNKIDGAVAGILSWQARSDAIREGVRSGSKYNREDLIVFGEEVEGEDDDSDDETEDEDEGDDDDAGAEA